MLNNLVHFWGFVNFNDRLALIVIIFLPVFWLVEALTQVSVSGEINGAMVMAWGLVMQYYFRRAPENPENGTPQPTPPSVPALPTTSNNGGTT